ncbi:MAG: hypothetical protein O2826_01735 [Chloroflexi bacterium]|nr:hypothetical protein [Chloroflexota bacterium]
MSVGTTRWLIDVCLPRDSYDGIDAVHASDFSRTPGPVGLSEALGLDRTLVTCGGGFRGSGALALDHPGVVVFTEAPTDATEVERNLKHLEFRIRQYEGELALAGNRFVIRADKELLMVGPAGEEVPLEPWREIHMMKAPAYVV